MPTYNWYSQLIKPSWALRGVWDWLILYAVIVVTFDAFFKYYDYLSKQVNCFSA